MSQRVDWYSEKKKMSQNLKYKSTRGMESNLSFQDVLLNGLARDGGLYMPEKWPKFSYKELLEMQDLDYTSLAEKIILPFVGSNLKQKIGKISRKVYKKFNGKEKAPLIKLEDNFYLMELFHGPTFAFKDYAMQFLSELFSEVLNNSKRKIVILGATSGDTGSAALEAFRGKKNTDIFILFPHDRVSLVQRKQMTSINQKGCIPIAVRTDFDGCQDIVKNLFSDNKFRNQVSLSAINSINWGRLVPQIVYYFYGALKLGAPKQKVSFSVPTGNFGNILAGWIAMKMGLPIEKLICGSNQNDILTRFFYTGKMERKNVIPSLSPSMDIQVSSNFERLLFEILNRDSKKLIELMKKFNISNHYDVPENNMMRLKETFLAFKASDNDIINTIKNTYDRYKYLLDPHTAVAVFSGEKALKNKLISKDTPLITLGCAHPAKFPDTILKSLNFKPKNPIKLEKIVKSKENFEVIDNDLEVIKNYILKKMRS